MQKTQEEINQFINVGSKNIPCNKNGHEDHFLSAFTFENDILQAICSQCAINNNKGEKLHPWNKVLKEISENYLHFLEPTLLELRNYIQALLDLEKQIGKQIQVEKNNFQQQIIPKIIEAKTSEQLDQQLKEISKCLKNNTFTLTKINIIPKNNNGFKYQKINELLKDTNGNAQEIISLINYKDEDYFRKFDPEYKHEGVRLQNNNEKAENPNSGSRNGVLLQRPISQDKIEYQVFKVGKQVNNEFLGICNKQESININHYDNDKSSKAVALYYGGRIHHNGGQEIQSNTGGYKENDIVIVKVNLKNKEVSFRNYTKGTQYKHRAIEQIDNNEQYFYVGLSGQNNSTSVLPMKEKYLF